MQRTHVHVLWPSILVLDDLHTNRKDHYHYMYTMANTSIPKYACPSVMWPGILVRMTFVQIENATTIQYLDPVCMSIIACICSVFFSFTLRTIECALIDLHT